ncbi:Rne/Rng family ribonuclease [Metabacillus indicus]|uniref:Rne/Rng family ribonuclease n=1 Tax=Metabacillus indicus TaxID=246786 RepID=UPI003CF67998
MRTLLFNAKGSENRCALLEDNQIQEIHIHHIHETAGAIYAGRVLNVLKGMAAAFVDIGSEKNGYLSFHDLPSSMEKRIREGQQIIVQVAKEATEHKGPKLTAKLEFGGQYLVYMPDSGYTAVSKKIEDSDERERLLSIGASLCKEEEGLVFRTAANGREKEELTREFDYLKGKYQEAKRKKTDKVPCLLAEGTPFFDRMLREYDLGEIDRIVCDESELALDLKARCSVTEVIFHQSKQPIFEAYGAEQEMEKALKRIIWLSNGSYLVFDKTEAMTVIDVNTGKFSGKSSLQDTVLKTNLAAAKEAARQIRLRNLSGMIIIDFIDMDRQEDRQAVLSQMLKEAKRDKVQSRIIGFTQMNIFQMTRKRVRPDLASLLMSPCPHCSGTGTVVSAETTAFRLERELWERQYMEHEAVLVELPADAARIFRGEQDVHIKRLESVLRFRIFLNPSSESGTYRIVHQGDMEEIIRLLKNKEKM